MKTVISSRLIVEHQRRGLGLPCFVASFQKCGVFVRISLSIFAEYLRPSIGDLREVRISAASEFSDQFRQRVGEVLVIADAEAIALHDDVAPKSARIIV